MNKRILYSNEGSILLEIMAMAGVSLIMILGMLNFMSGFSQYAKGVRSSLNRTTLEQNLKTQLINPASCFASIGGQVFPQPGQWLGIDVNLDAVGRNVKSGSELKEFELKQVNFALGNVQSLGKSSGGKDIYSSLLNISTQDSRGMMLKPLSLNLTVEVDPTTSIITSCNGAENQAKINCDLLQGIYDPATNVCIPSATNMCRSMGGNWVDGKCEMGVGRRGVASDVSYPGKLSALSHSADPASGIPECPGTENKQSWYRTQVMSMRGQTTQQAVDIKAAQSGEDSLNPWSGALNPPDCSSNSADSNAQSGASCQVKVTVDDIGPNITVSQWIQFKCNVSALQPPRFPREANERQGGEVY